MSIQVVAVPRPRTLTVVQRHPLITSFALTYAAAWLFWMPLVVCRHRMTAALGFLLTNPGTAVSAGANPLERAAS